MILREAFLGTRRFDEFQGRLGIARNVLQSRLERLTEGGIMRRVAYQERPVRYEYRLTHKGVDLWPAIVALMKWGDQYAAPDGPQTLLQHKDCRGEVDDRRRCTRCGAELEAWDVVPVRGPGASDRRLPEPAAAEAQSAPVGSTSR